jgi:hypothetical protein
VECDRRSAATLVVVVTRGRTGLSRIVRMSVAESVIRRFPVPDGEPCFRRRGRFHEPWPGRNLFVRPSPELSAIDGAMP